MTDENGLTPARPVAPRHKLSANPQMAQPMGRSDSPPTPEPDYEPEPSLTLEEEPILLVEPEPEPALEPPPELVAVPVIAPAPAAPARQQPAPIQAQDVAPNEPEFDFPRTMRATLARVDQSWAAFRGAALRFPSERMDERLGEDGWTRKQMLEHIAAWHNLTADRLIVLINTGKPAPLDRDTDQFNAAIARRAVGKSSGEVLQDMDATFNRLRRQMARMTDAQLQTGEWWAAFVIGGNTYGHYEEHWADIYTPELPLGSARARR
jgi:hypothetical protein